MLNNKHKYKTRSSAENYENHFKKPPNSDNFLSLFEDHTSIPLKIININNQSQNTITIANLRKENKTHTKRCSMIMPSGLR